MSGREVGGERVSVIIPSYNCAPYLSEAIESVLDQSHPPAEVIVVDDGSTDDSLEIARGFGARIRLLAQANAGVSAARNRAIEEATGDWLAFLDADDVWLPTKLERQLAAVEGRPDVVCVFSDFYRFGEGMKPTLEHQPDNPAAPDWRVRMLCSYVLPSTCMVRVDALGDVRFRVGAVGEDMIFFAELRERGSFLQVPEPLARYRIREGSAIHRSIHEIRSIDARYEFMMEHADRYSENEQLAVRRYLSNLLQMGHERALWQQRDPKLVRAYRRGFDQIHPPDIPEPRNFRRRLYPRWMYRLRDAFRSFAGI